MHIFCAAVQKPCRKKKRINPELPHIYVFVFFLPLLWNYPLWLHLTSFKKGCISLFPHRAWPASPHPPLSLLTIITAAFLYCHFCGLCGDKEAPGVTLLGCAKLKKDSQHRQKCWCKSHSYSVFFFFFFRGVLSRSKTSAFSAGPCSRENQWAKST